MRFRFAVAGAFDRAASVTVMPRIHILPSGLTLDADPAENLLKVLRRNQIPIRYSCRSGECGSCKCVLESGQVEMKAFHPKALPATQRQAGVILACRATVQDDITLRLIDSDDLIFHPERKLLCRVLAVDEVAPEVFSLRLHIEYADQGGVPFTFSAGQYAQLVLDVDGQEVRRDFSMASTPVDAEYDDLLEFHIRRSPDGAFSRHLGGRIRPDTALLVQGPMGTSYFRPRHEGPIYAVGGGTGLAPMLSIVQTALANGVTEPVTLYAGFRTLADAYRLDLLESLRREWPNFRYVIALDQPPEAPRPHVVAGPVGAALLRDVADFAGAKVYLAGPPAMVETLAADLLARGVPERDIHADAFYPLGAAEGASAVTSLVAVPSDAPPSA